MQSYSYVNQIRRLQSPVRYQRAGDDDTSRDLAEFYASHWNDLASQGLEPTEEGLWKAETELDKPISARDIPEPWGGANEPIQEPESYVDKVKAKATRKGKDDGEDYFALPSKRRPSKFDAATEDLGGKTYAEVIAEKMKKAGATS